MIDYHKDGRSFSGVKLEAIKGRVRKLEKCILSFGQQGLPKLVAKSLK